MFVDIVHLPKEYRPNIEDLPGDLKRIAAVIEAHITGEGVRITLLLAQAFHGNPVYFRNINRFILAWRDDCIRAEYDHGGVTARALAVKHKLCLRSVEKILARPNSKDDRPEQIDANHENLTR